MVDVSKIKEDLMVHAKGLESMHGAPGEHIGTVDKVEGSKYIKLTKADSLDNQHHWFPIDWIESVDDRAVYLNKSASEARSELINQAPAVS